MNEVLDADNQIILNADFDANTIDIEQAYITPTRETAKERRYRARKMTPRKSTGRTEPRLSQSDNDSDDDMDARSRKVRFKNKKRKKRNETESENDSEGYHSRRGRIKNKTKLKKHRARKSTQREQMRRNQRFIKQNKLSPNKNYLSKNLDYTKQLNYDALDISQDDETYSLLVNDGDGSYISSDEAVTESDEEHLQKQQQLNELKVLKSESLTISERKDDEPVTIPRRSARLIQAEIDERLNKFFPKEV